MSHATLSPLGEFTALAAGLTSLVRQARPSLAGFRSAGSDIPHPVALNSAVSRMSLGFRLASARELVTQAAVDSLVLGLQPDGGEWLLDLHSGSSQVAAAAELGMSSGRVISLSLDPNACNADASANATRVRLTRDGYLPFTDASFEVVLSRLALCRFPERAQRARLLREIARVLKPSGRLMLVEDCNVRHYFGMLNAMQLPLTECYAESLLLYPRLTLFRATIGLNSSRFIRHSPRGDAAASDNHATAP